MNICVYGSASDEINSLFLTGGEELGEEMARRGHSLVFGGGARGMMGAVARGAHRMGGRIVGVAPGFFPDGALFPHCTTFHKTETMRERKGMMEELSSAFIVTPGGIGTLEEFFEIYTLRHLGRTDKPIALYNVGGVFDPLLALLRGLCDEGFLPREDLSLLLVAETVGELLDLLEK